MQDLNGTIEFNKVENARHALRNTFATCAFGLMVGSSLIFSTAWAEEQPAHDMHDMHDMHHMHEMSDMKDMPAMEHMDHSKHKEQLSKRGTYSRSVKSYMIPDVKLVAASGQAVSLRELMDDHSTIMLNFIFTTCTTICPVMTSTFQQVQQKLGKRSNEVRMVSISIDPENDSPAKLAEYAAKYKAGSQWTFLTGTLDNSLLVQKAFDVFAGEKMNHKPITFLKVKDSDSQWVRIEGLVDADQIVNEYDKLSMGNMKHE